MAPVYAYICTGEPASADVRADGQLFYISWGNERLKRVQIENPGFWVKLQNCLNKDLIDKVKPKNKENTEKLQEAEPK